MISVVYRGQESSVHFIVSLTKDTSVPSVFLARSDANSSVQFNWSAIFADDKSNQSVVLTNGSFYGLLFPNVNLDLLQSLSHFAFPVFIVILSTLSCSSTKISEMSRTFRGLLVRLLSILWINASGSFRIGTRCRMQQPDCYHSHYVAMTQGLQWYSQIKASLNSRFVSDYSIFHVHHLSHLFNLGLIAVLPRGNYLNHIVKIVFWFSLAANAPTFYGHDVV